MAEGETARGDRARDTYTISGVGSTRSQVSKMDGNSNSEDGDSDSEENVSNSEDGDAESDYSTFAKSSPHSRTETETLAKKSLCTLCSLQFKSRDDLKQHRRQDHSGEKQFECPDCRKTFARYDKLSQHQRSTHQPTSDMTSSLHDPEIPGNGASKLQTALRSPTNAKIADAIGKSQPSAEDASYQSTQQTPKSSSSTQTIYQNVFSGKNVQGEDVEFVDLCGSEEEQEALPTVHSQDPRSNKQAKDNELQHRDLRGLPRAADMGIAKKSREVFSNARVNSNVGIKPSSNVDGTSTRNIGDGLSIPQKRKHNDDTNEIVLVKNVRTGKLPRNIQAARVDLTEAPKTVAFITPPHTPMKVSSINKESITPIPLQIPNTTAALVPNNDSTGPFAFSLKPPVWTPWRARDYQDLATAIASSLVVDKFATDHNRTRADVLSVLQAAVLRPLSDIDEAKKRTEKGIAQLFALYQDHGTAIRIWAKGSGYEIVGELRDIRLSEIIVVGRSRVKVDQQKQPKKPDTVVIPVTVLTKDDRQWLFGCLTEEEIKLLGRIFKRPRPTALQVDTTTKLTDREAELMTTAKENAEIGDPSPITASTEKNEGQRMNRNDAISHLCEVKVQFADRPDIYNKFLEIMKRVNYGTIDIPSVIGEVTALFAGHPKLIQDFNAFIPDAKSTPFPKNDYSDKTL